jgi:two-component system response regulator AlgR
MSAEAPRALRALIADDEPLAIERMQVLCAELAGITVIGTASDGEAALRLAEKLAPEVVLLDMTMPGMDGLAVARRLAKFDDPPAVIFVTAHEDFAVEAFDLEAVDYVLKPVAADRLERAIERALARRQRDLAHVTGGVPVQRIDAERDYVRLFAGERTYLLLQTIAGLEEKLDPQQFIRIHRSTILRRNFILGLRHEGLGVWCAELADGQLLRIGRTYLHKVKAMAGR